MPDDDDEFEITPEEDDALKLAAAANQDWWNSLTPVEQYRYRRKTILTTTGQWRWLYRQYQLPFMTQNIKRSQVRLVKLRYEFRHGHKPGEA